MPFVVQHSARVFQSKPRRPEGGGRLHKGEVPIQDRGRIKTHPVLAFNDRFLERRRTTGRGGRGSNRNRMCPMSSTYLLHGVYDVDQTEWCATMSGSPYGTNSSDP